MTTGPNFIYFEKIFNQIDDELVVSLINDILKKEENGMEKLHSTMIPSLTVPIINT